MVYILTALSSCPMENTFMKLIFEHNFSKRPLPQTRMHGETIPANIEELSSSPYSVSDFFSVSPGFIDPIEGDQSISMILINLLLIRRLGLSNLHLNLTCLVRYFLLCGPVSGSRELFNIIAISFHVRLQ